MENDVMNIERFAVEINTDLCGDCVYCLSACPFEAISRDEETKVILVDREKCRLCGICAATCPSSLISIPYYDIETLSEFIEKRIVESGAQKMTIACRGTGLTPGNWQEKMEVDGDDTIFFTLPCLGRIYLNFLLRALELGIEDIYLISCEEEFCRNKEGSKITKNKFDAAQLLFEDMGYYADQLHYDTRSPKVRIEDDKCIACGTCAFLCPYEAIVIEKSAKLDVDKCMGCGICVSNCPAKAITLESSSFDVVSNEINDFARRAIDPKILVLGCQWSEYSRVDRSENEDDPEDNVKFIRMPCSGRIDVLHILKALSLGVDGVLLSICMDDICSLETGNKWTKAKVKHLKSLLEKLGLSDRVEICPAHPKYLGVFEDQLDEFTKRVHSMGPSPLKGVIN